MRTWAARSYVGHTVGSGPIRSSARLVCNARQLRLRLAQGMFHKREFWALHRHILNLAPAR